MQDYYGNTVLQTITSILDQQTFVLTTFFTTTPGNKGCCNYLRFPKLKTYICVMYKQPVNINACITMSAFCLFVKTKMVN